jgi:hypothetical protein
MTDGDRLEEIESRLDELEADLDAQHDDRMAYRRQVLLPRLDEADEARDDLTSQVGELQDTVQQLRDRVRDLEAGYESVLGLAEEQQSSPDKRCADLRLGLIRTAEAKADGRTAAMHYKAVQSFFASHGHGEVKKPEVYKAMNAAAEYQGFTLRDDELVLPSGRSGRAIIVDLDKLPSRVNSENSSSATTLADGGRDESRHSTSRSHTENTVTE